MFKKLKEFCSNERGNVVVMTSLVAVPMLVVIGSAIDTGRLQQHKRDLSAATEAAVIASCSPEAIRSGEETQMRRAMAIFMANLQNSGQITDVENDYVVDVLNEDLIKVDFAVKAKISGFLAGFENFQNQDVLFVSSAYYFPKSGRPPVFSIENSNDGKLKYQ